MLHHTERFCERLNNIVKWLLLSAITNSLLHPMTSVRVPREFWFPYYWVISCKHLRDEDKYWGLSSVIANGDERSMEIVEINNKQKTYILYIPACLGNDKPWTSVLWLKTATIYLRPIKPRTAMILLNLFKFPFVLILINGSASNNLAELWVF